MVASLLAEDQEKRRPSDNDIMFFVDWFKKKFPSLFQLKTGKYYTNIIYIVGWVSSQELSSPGVSS